MIVHAKLGEGGDLCTASSSRGFAVSEAALWVGVPERPTVGHVSRPVDTVRAMAGRTRRANSLSGEALSVNRPRQAAVLTRNRGQAGAIVVTVPLEPRYLSAPPST
jgi:hypothetical protein